MSAPDPELAHLEDAINELASLLGRTIQLASDNGVLEGAVRLALVQLRHGSAMQAQTILGNALSAIRGDA